MGMKKKSKKIEVICNDEFFQGVLNRGTLDQYGDLNWDSLMVEGTDENRFQINAYDHMVDELENYLQFADGVYTYSFDVYGMKKQSQLTIISAILDLINDLKKTL